MSRSKTRFRFTRSKTEVSAHVLIAVDETGQVAAYSVDRCEDVDRLIVDIGEDMSGRVEVHHLTRTLKIPKDGTDPLPIKKRELVRIFDTSREKSCLPIDRSAPSGHIAVNMILAIDQEGNVAVDTIDDINSRVRKGKKRSLSFHEAAKTMLKLIKFYDPIDIYCIRHVFRIPRTELVEIDPNPELILTTRTPRCTPRAGRRQ